MGDSSIAIATPLHPQHGEAIDGLPPRPRFWAGLAIALALALAVLDASIANVALPTIASELRVSVSAATFVVNAYQLAILISLLPLAALGEIAGYRKVYLTGLVLFVLGSLGCALSNSLPHLIAARAVQGFGAAGIMAVNSALVRFIYPRASFGRAIGMNTMVMSLSMAGGPSLASAVLAVAPWPWLFGLNVPVGVCVIMVAWFSLPDTPLVHRAFDWVSALLIVASLALLILATELLPMIALYQRAIILIAAVATAIFLLRRELSHPAPLVPFDLLRLPLFRLSWLTSTCTFCAWSLASVSLPFFVQSTMGYSAVETGLLMTPWPVAAGLTAPIAGALADRISSPILCAAGLAIMATALLMLACLPLGSSALDIGLPMALSGFGFGIYLSPNNRTLLLAAPLSRSGAAGGMQATARLLGQALGTAVVASIFRIQGIVPGRVSLVCGAIMAVAAALISLKRMTEKNRQAAID